MTPTIRHTVDPQGIATVWFNRPEKSVNTFIRLVLHELSAALSAAEVSTVRGVIFASEKPTTFIAGADLAEFAQLDRAGVEQFLQEGQVVFSRLEQLPVPTIAVINGHCLGGGLELALACRYRIAADDPACLIGLPEVSLGLIPAWGGTVRLPRLIGFEAAAPLMLEGSKFSPQEARRLGVVDQLVPREGLLEAAKQYILNPPSTRMNAMKDRLHSDPANIRAILTQARQQAIQNPDACLPAIDQLVTVIETGQTKGAVAGLEAERHALADLMENPECRSCLDRFLTRRRG